MIEEHNLTPAAARTFLRRLRLEGRAVYLVVAHRAQTVSGSDATVRGSVELSKTAAVDFIARAYDAPDLRVRIAVGDTVVVVGRG